MDQHEAETKTAKFITIGMSCVAIILITSITSCAIHSDQMGAVNTAAKASYLEVQTNQEKEQSDAIKELIASGTNPVAARCAIIGWENERDALVCAVSGAKNPKKADSISDQ